MQVNHGETIIKIENVSFSWNKELILEDITLDMHRGDYLGLVGPNGAGKTTLLKIILGLLKPDKGSIKLFGQNIKEFKDWQKIGYVPQTWNYSQGYFPATVGEVVAMARIKNKGFFKIFSDQDKKIIQETLAMVGMEKYENSLIEELSQGQRQRILIAKALAQKPEVIFFDESISSTDKNFQENFYKILKKINKEKNITIILVTHDIEKITKEATHIACVNRRLVCHLSPQDFIKESRSINIFGQDIKIINHKH